MEMGEAGHFAATCRLRQGEHKGFRNLEGHRFMTAVTMDTYTYTLNIRELACVVVFRSRRMMPVLQSRSRFVR
ncbi:hypothetical protein ALC62_14643 [Cyphomyrmex costatus]|uniref:Uncharacterized protein n=1 Tax=Cyphomyrmex costatus TaxID=456900 RepID=A0A195C3A6_9HYME|nr:hypothetical protein ALC62_14643 [Cyphomyrmex costatus]